MKSRNQQLESSFSDLSKAYDALSAKDKENKVQLALFGSPEDFASLKYVKPPKDPSSFILVQTANSNLGEREHAPEAWGLMELYDLLLNQDCFFHRSESWKKSHWLRAGRLQLLVIYKHLSWRNSRVWECSSLTCSRNLMMLLLSENCIAYLLHSRWKLRTW